MHQPRHPRKIPAGRTGPLRTVVVEIVPLQGTGEPQPRVRPPARRSRRLPQTTVHIITILNNPGLNPRIPPRPRTGAATIPAERHADTAEHSQPRKHTTIHHHRTHGVMMTAESYRGPRDALPMRWAGLRSGRAPRSSRSGACAGTCPARSGTPAGIRRAGRFPYPGQGPPGRRPPGRSARLPERRRPR